MGEWALGGGAGCCCMGYRLKYLAMRLVNCPTAPAENHTSAQYHDCSVTFETPKIRGLEHLPHIPQRTLCNLTTNIARTHDLSRTRSTKSQKEQNTSAVATRCTTSSPQPLASVRYRLATSSPEGQKQFPCTKLASGRLFKIHLDLPRDKSRTKTEKGTEKERNTHPSINTLRDKFEPLAAQNRVGPHKKIGDET